MQIFCTFFDHRFISRGVALHGSLAKHCPGFQLWILCMDDMALRALKKKGLTNVRLISIDEFESGDERLRNAKGNRSLIEYYFTCKASMPFYIFKNYPEVTRITYLDADLFFFADPAVIDVGDSSIAIVEHRFPEKIISMRRFGLYNAGWLSFKRDDNGMACLTWWRERCLEWCHDQPEGERFADQKYIDQFSNLFTGVRVIKNKGANLAPWNTDNYKLTWTEGRVLVDAEPLVFFHFHGLHKIVKWVFESGFANYGAELTEVAVKHIYLPYMDALFETAQTMDPFIQAGASDGIGQKVPRGRARGRVSRLSVKIVSSIKRIFKALWYQSYIHYLRKPVSHTGL